MKTQALEIVKKLKAAGHQAVIAGGAIRDMLLGIEPSDYDIATDAKPDVVEALFDKTLAIGKSFGVIIVIQDGFEIEVATFRQDGDYGDGRRPDTVSFSSMEEDARRRDLTINGMFYDPIEDRIIDFVGGQKDLEAGIIRLIGNPEERIQEDKLRMLRVVRFAARFKFKIDPQTLEAVKKHAMEINQVSVERIADELIKMMKTGNYSMFFDLLFETGLIDYVLPEIRDMKGCEQPPVFHPEGDVYKHTMIALEALPQDASDELRMGVLLHDVGKPDTQTFEDRIRFSNHENVGYIKTEKILKRLKFSNNFIERVCDLVKNHMKFMAVKEMRTSRLKRFIGMPYFEEHLALHKVDCISSHGELENYDFLVERLNSYEPEEIKPPRIVTGNDLLQLGFQQGPIFKDILLDIEDKQLEGTFSNKEEVLEYVERVWK